MLLASAADSRVPATTTSLERRCPHCHSENLGARDVNFMAFDLDEVVPGEGNELLICYELKRPHVNPQDCLFLNTEQDSQMAAVLELLLEGQMTFNESEHDCTQLVG